MSGVEEPTQKKAWFSNKEWLVLAVALSIALAGTVAGALAPRPKAATVANNQTVAEPNLPEPPVVAESLAPSADETTTGSQSATTTNTTDTASSSTTSTASTSTAKKKSAKKKAAQATPKQKAKPQAEAPATTTPTTSVAALGLTLNYGNYQGAPITWRVLELKKDEILLISDAVLTSGAWRSDWENGGANVYKNSSVRAWLNGDFFTTSFSTAEANACMKRVLSGGLKDKVFLLNQQEAMDYFATPALRAAAPSAWAGTHAGYSGEDLTVEQGKAAWWLLDSEKKSDWEVRLVRNDGKFDKAPVYYGDIGLRPAIVLDRASVNLSLTVPAP